MSQFWTSLLVHDPKKVADVFKFDGTGPVNLFCDTSLQTDHDMSNYSESYGALFKQK